MRLYLDLKVHFLLLYSSFPIASGGENLFQLMTSIRCNLPNTFRIMHPHPTSQPLELTIRFFKSFYHFHESSFELLLRIFFSNAPKRLYVEMPKMTKCPSMTNCPKSKCPNNIQPKYDKMPRVIKRPKDIMPMMTICPKSHFAQGDKMPKLSCAQHTSFDIFFQIFY